MQVVRKEAVSPISFTGTVQFLAASSRYSQTAPTVTSRG